MSSVAADVAADAAAAGGCFGSLRPFGIAAMVRIFKYLTVLMDPHQAAWDGPDARCFGLRLVMVALETAGHHLNEHPELIGLLQDDLCRQLLINSQSGHFVILSLALRVIFDLFCSVKEHIRVQLEVFFISIHVRIASSSATKFEHKELVLESMVEFCREPDLIVGLYTNYDCQVGSTHLFEDLCHFLAHFTSTAHCPPSERTPAPIHIATKTATATATATNNKQRRRRHQQKVPFPPEPTARTTATATASPSTHTLQRIAAEGILAVIDCIARKLIDCGPSLNSEQRSAEYEHIQREQLRKRSLKTAARCFNAVAVPVWKSLPELQSEGALSTPLDPQDVATFLHSNPYLDRVRIGEFLGAPQSMTTHVLHHYLALCDLKHKEPDHALRHFLEHFVLRGESQQIERIIEKFSEKMYVERPPGSPLKSKDAAFLLSYSMIQLNTDAHNSQIKTKVKRHCVEFPFYVSIWTAFVHQNVLRLTSRKVDRRSGKLRECIHLVGQGISGKWV